MQAQKVPAKHGLNWVADGYRLFAKSPLLLTLLIFGYFFILVASTALPVVGPLAALVLVPTFSVGLMVACRSLDADQAVEWRQLFAGFHLNFPVLLRLGFVFLAPALSILWVTGLLDGDAQIQSTVAGTSVEPLLDEKLLSAINMASLLLFPVLIVFSFAAMLSAWRSVPAVKSLFFSCVAGLHNIGAFLSYGAFLFVLTGFLPALVLIVAVALFDTAGAVAAIILLTPISFIMFAVVLTSVYASYRDIFRDDAFDRTTGEGPPAT